MIELTCIVCPNSCTLKYDEKTKTVTGNRCIRGEKYCISELTNPTRSVTSTIKTVFDDIPVVSVSTNGEIPKGDTFKVMKVLSSFVLDKKVEIGSVVIKNILGSGVDIITTSEM